MSKVAVLHIGSGKTGTTTIQDSLAKNKDRNDSIIFYPNLVESGSNQVFRFAFCELKNATKNIRLRFANDEEGYLQYQQEIKKSLVTQCESVNKIIISSEFLFHCNQEEIENISLFLNQAGFSELHIIVYLRNPSSYYLSVAQQALKNGPKLPNPLDFNYDLTGAVKRWSNIQPKSFVVREFDRKKLKNNNIICDFAEVLKQVGFDGVDFENISSSNETMSVEAILAVQDAQMTLDRQNFDSHQLSKFWRKIRIFCNSQESKIGTKPKLKKKIEMQILARFASDLDYIKANHGIFTDFDKSKNTTEFSRSSFRFFDEIVTKFDYESYLKFKGMIK